MMHDVERLVELRQIVGAWRQTGERIALVPTMGNLHAGHLSLVAAAREHADRVVVSSFVNPTQFGPGEDYDSYPRTLEADRHHLMGRADLLFLPAKDVMYPPGASTQITVAGVSERHCGASRPGHFSGVATVVTKLFNLVQPELAFFGEKDFQQLAVIRQLVQDLNMPVTVQGVPTVREADGLAMSSRNTYLTPAQRKQAPLLYQTLCTARHRLLAGETEYAAIELDCLQTLKMAGFEPDYFVICRSADLAPAQPGDIRLVILTAAKLGQPRLIDNIQVVLAEGCG